MKDSQTITTERFIGTDEGGVRHERVTSAGVRASSTTGARLYKSPSFTGLANILFVFTINATSILAV